MTDTQTEAAVISIGFPLVNRLRNSLSLSDTTQRQNHREGEGEGERGEEKERRGEREGKEICVWFFSALCIHNERK
jgi:hypothetical protein